MIRILLKLSVAAFLISSPAWASETVFSVQSYVVSGSGPSLHLNRDYRKNGSYSADGIDVLMEYRVCPDYHKSYCIFQNNRNVIFSIPKSLDDQHRNWEFGGLQFRIQDVSESKRTFVIHGYPLETFKEYLSDSGYELQKYVYLYKRGVGLTSFSRVLKLPEGERQTTVWVFSKPVDFELLNEQLDEYANLTEAEIKLLEAGEFTLPDR